LESAADFVTAVSVGSTEAMDSPPETTDVLEVDNTELASLTSSRSDAPKPAAVSAAPAPVPAPLAPAPVSVAPAPAAAAPSPVAAPRAPVAPPSSPAAAPAP